MLVCLEVKCILLAEAKLQQIVIERLLGHINFQSSVLQGESDELTVLHDAIVKTAPEADLLDDVLYVALFGPLWCLVRLFFLRSL